MGRLNGEVQRKRGLLERVLGDLRIPRAGLRGDPVAVDRKIGKRWVKGAPLVAEGPFFAEKRAVLHAIRIVFLTFVIGTGKPRAGRLFGPVKS